MQPKLNIIVQSHAESATTSNPRGWGRILTLLITWATPRRPCKGIGNRVRSPVIRLGPDLPKLLTILANVFCGRAVLLMEGILDDPIFLSSGKFDRVVYTCRVLPVFAHE